MIHLKLSLMIFFAPFDTFYGIQEYRHQMRKSYSIFIYFMSLVSQYIYINTVHYPMVYLRPMDTNIILEFVKLGLPVLIWVIASYAITTIIDGETKFADIFHASALAMLPVIIFKPLIGITSNMMSHGEMGLFSFLQTVIIVWMVLLLFTGLYKMNDYTLLKSFGITALSIVAMLIICALALLIYALTSQLLIFFSDIATEIRMT